MRSLAIIAVVFTLAVPVSAAVWTPIIVEESSIPYIGVNDAGNLYTAEMELDDPGSQNWANLAAEFAIGRDDLVIALQLYMQQEKGVVFGPNPDKQYFQSLIGVSVHDSGLKSMLAAIENGEPVPTGAITFYINALIAAGATPAGELGKSHDCGSCAAGERPSRYCGSGLCVKACGSYSGACWSAGTGKAADISLFAP